MTGGRSGSCLLGGFGRGFAYVPKSLAPLRSSLVFVSRAGIERTYNFRQEDILKHVEVGAARKAFDLQLPDLGPYRVDFTRNGRYM